MVAIAESPLKAKTLHFHNTEDVPPPTISEVDTAIQRLKNNKSPGSDGMPTELLKSAGSCFNRAFHLLLKFGKRRDA